MDCKKRNKWRRRFKIYREYFLGFAFIAGIMVLALAINLVKALSSKPAEVKVVAETETETSTSYSVYSVSVTFNPEKLMAGCSLATFQFLSEDIDVIENDNDIVKLAYESKPSDSKKDRNSKPECESESEPQSVPEPATDDEDYDEELEYNLAKLIDAEGSIVDDYSQQLIAYCFLNRMRSDHWKSSFNAILNDGIGYAERTCEYVANPENVPSEKALKNAKICLENHYADTMPVPYNLVYQSGFKQGTVYYYDETHGVYFCLADRLEPND